MTDEERMAEIERLRYEIAFVMGLSRAERRKIAKRTKTPMLRGTQRPHGVHKD